MGRSEDAIVSVTAQGIILSLRVLPRASKNEICGIQDDALKIKLTSPPVDGAANKLCREFLSELLAVPKSAVEIISGETSRHKRVRISCDEPERLRQTFERIIAHCRNRS